MALDLCVPQIRPNLPDFSELSLCILSANRWWYDDIVTNLPIDRRCNALIIRSLQRINNSQNLKRISSTACRIHHRQTNLLRRIDYKNRADGEGDAFLINILQVLSVQHIV